MRTYRQNLLLWAILFPAFFMLFYDALWAHEEGLGDYVVKAYRLEDVLPPKIDGKLDDPCWKLAKPVSGFIQKEPDPGKPATDDTEAYVLYDRYNLYLGFRCYDKEPDKVISRIARRGNCFISDTISVFLDPYHDHRTGYKLTISPKEMAESYSRVLGLDTNLGFLKSFRLSGQVAKSFSKKQQPIGGEGI